MEPVVHRQRPPGLQRHAGGAHRTRALIGQFGFLEEDVGAVLPHQTVRPLRIDGEPVADGGHGHGCGAEFAALDQQPADGRERMAALGRVVDPHQPAVGKAQPRAALHMGEKHIHPGGGPGNFQPLSVKSAGFDRLPVGTGRGDAAVIEHEGEAGRDRSGRIVRIGDRHQIVRLAQERKPVAGVRPAANGNLGFVIAGHQSRTAARADFDRPEPGLEEFASPQIR